jgi:hypothetical protein
MTCFIAKIALATRLLAVAVSATNAKSKFSTKGYNAYATAQFDGCPELFGSSLEVSVYGVQSRFKQTSSDDENGTIVETNKFDDFYLLVSSSTCNDTTLTYKRGAVYDSQDYGDEIETNFAIERNSLTKASLQGLEVPIYSNECSYYCTETCYPEIFGYGACPTTETARLECYTVHCGVEEYIGNAKVSVFWKVPKRWSKQQGLTQAPWRSGSTAEANAVQTCQGVTGK